MSNYEFQSTLHGNSSEAHDAVAAEWISAGGLNGKDSILEALNDFTDTEIAAECLDAWDMTALEWFDVAELVEAVAALRENPDQYILGWGE